MIDLYKRWDRLGIFGGPNPIFIPKKRPKKKAVRRKKGNKKGFARLSKLKIAPSSWIVSTPCFYRINLETGAIYWENPQVVGQGIRSAVKS